MGYRSNIKAPTYTYPLYDLKNRNPKKLYCPELLLAVHKCHHCVLLNIHYFLQEHKATCTEERQSH